MTITVSRLTASLVLAPLMLAPAACSPGSPGGAHLPSLATATNARAAGKKMPSTKLKHIVVLIQENRTVDNLFNGFCPKAGICADTVTKDPVSGTALRPVSLAAPYSPNHDHGQYVLQAAGGWAQSQSSCNNTIGPPIPCKMNVFAFVPPSEAKLYWKLATVDGLLSDETFQTNQGPTLPAHLYAIGGQSGGYDSDHWALAEGSNSCASQTTYQQIDMTTPYPGNQGNPVPPCKDFTTIFDLLANAGHTWRYYSNSADHSFYSATQNIRHLYNSPNFIVPPAQFITDVGKGNLADVTFVMPTGGQSDHPGWVNHATYGPLWVASVVNAVGKSSFWADTAVVVWWDDWGGWFDHVTPPPPSGMPSWMGNPDPFEYGFRVPLIVASPYARVGQIDHTARTFVSTLRLIEETFGLGSLATADQYEPDGLDSMFDFNQKPVRYKPL